MLKIKNLTAVSHSEPLIENISLEIKPGEIHAVMGPKHSGKSALAHAISGHPSVNITDGDIFWGRKKLQNLDPTERNELGIFISFQFPPEFEGITNFELTKEFFKPFNVDNSELQLKYNTCCSLLELGSDHGELTPSINHMSINQAKRNELVYMFLSNPKLIILDEIDEGLTNEQITSFGNILKDYIAERDRSCLIVTHSKELLNILQPTHVHVMVDGEIKMSGNNELFTRIIEDGYSQFS